MTNIGIIGYGRMGREIERLAPAADCTVQFIYDTGNPASNALPDAKAFKATDCILEFTTPGTALDSIRIAAEHGTNIVVGTTGWYDKLDDAKELIETWGTGLLYAQNFALGIQLFMRIVRYAAGVVNAFDEYDIGIHEAHHNKKVDAPSGTALHIADALLKGVDRKTAVQTQLPDGPPDPAALYVTSERVGNVPGTHTVRIDGTADTIELTHTARSREGLALGALRAARWMKGKKGIYTIEDMIDEIVED